MAGLVHQKIQKLMKECGSSKTQLIRTKLILKGIDPDKWGPTSDDTPDILEKLNILSHSLIRG